MRGIKTNKENKWKRPAAFLILLLVFGVLVNSVRKVYNKKVEAQKTLARMREEVKNLEDRQKFLGTSIQKLATEEGVAFEMRKKLNVASAGESVAIIVEGTQPTSTPVTEISSWQKLKDFFTKLFE